MTSVGRYLRPLADVVLALFVYPAAVLLRTVRTTGVRRLPRCKAALLRVGVFPISDHYYEPRFDYRGAAPRLAVERRLPGIDWNVAGQLAMAAQLTYAGELADLDRVKGDALDFHLDNGTFEAGDAEYWYQFIRSTKPRRIIEVGSGYSTLMATRAIRRNRDEVPGYACEHVCVEPYEVPWLEATGVTVIRRRVEDLDPLFFSRLEAGDILFIDSSHVIRPMGDVLFAYLELLPSLSPGVYVHVHDIFSPRHYPAHWVSGDVRLWNEQYLLEAFLSHNSDWTVLGALNYLHTHHPGVLRAVAPFVTPERQPGSFYMRKTR